MGRRVAACVAVIAIANALAGAGCTTPHSVWVSGRELHHNLIPLRDDGRATVDAVDVIDPRSTTDGAATRELITDDQPLYLLGTHRVIARELIDGCPVYPPLAEDHVSGASCPLVQHRDDPFLIRRYDDRTYSRTAAAVVTLAILSSAVAAGICEGECSDSSNWKTASSWTLLGEGVGLVLWLVLSCAGKWGQPGCRD